MPKDLKRAQLVKKMREERAWPQRQLADIAGINLRTIQRLERDGAASFDTLMAIAQALEISVAQLTPTAAKKTNEPPNNKLYLLPRLTSGKHLADLVEDTDFFQISHDSSDDERAINAMSSILDLLKQDIVRWHDAEPAKRLKVELELSQELKGLENYGFYLFGIKRSVPSTARSSKKNPTICTIYMSHAQSPKIVRDKNSNMMVPAQLSDDVK